MAEVKSVPTFNRPSTVVSSWLLMLVRRSSYTAQLGTTPIPLFGRPSTIELARVLSMANESADCSCGAGGFLHCNRIQEDMLHLAPMILFL